MIKFTILLARNPALADDQLVKHHKAVHAAMFMSVPVVKETVRRPVQLAPDRRRASLAMPSMQYDGIAELWFDDVAALARCILRPRVPGEHPAVTEGAIPQNRKPATSWFLRKGGREAVITPRLFYLPRSL